MTMVADAALISENTFKGKVPATVADLTGNERQVALYASDMPDRWSYGRTPEHKQQLLDWVMQGASRLGPGSLFRQGRFERACTLLAVHNLATDEVLAARRRMFPKLRRADRAHDLVSLTILLVGMTEAARLRNADAWIEPADCPCAGSGEIPLNVSWDHSAAYSVPCPAHGTRFVRDLRPAFDAIG